jgi:hypothetical protein
VFVFLLVVGISPLLMVNNVHVQFLGASLVLVFVLQLNAKFLDRTNFSEYGLALNYTTLSHGLVGMLIGILTVILILGIGWITQMISVTQSTNTINFTTMGLFGIKMLLVAFVEETFFRGYLFTTIYHGVISSNRKRAILWALIGSSFLFGLAHSFTNHASVFSILLLSINGLVWCIPFIITKNLGLSIGMHFTWNFSQTQIGFAMSGNEPANSYFNITNHGPDLLTGGSYGPEAGILGLIGYIIMLGLSLIFLNGTQKKPWLSKS